MRVREIPFTRADILLWLQGYNGPLSDNPTLRTRLRAQSRLGHLADEVIENEGNDSLPPTITLLELILLDIRSYA